MDFSTAWWMSGSSTENPDGPSPGPTPGFEIKNSLRFRGAQWLQRSGTALQSDSTVSFWFKYAMIKQPTAEQMLFGNSDSNTFFEIYANSTPNSDMLYSNLGGYGGTISGSPSLRDPSAWYHLVVQSTASSNTVWLNGVQVATGSSLGTSNYTNLIGKNSGSANFWNGLMADWYCIDGQALEPTAFGRELTTGQWVPREVDFTPAEMRLSDNVVTYTGAYDPNGTGTDFISPAVNGFDGDTSTFVVCRAVDNSRLQVNNLGLTGVTGLRLNVMSTQEFRVNGTVESFTGNAGATQPTWVTIDNPPADIDEISLLSVNNGRCRWSAIEVTDANGTRILTNPFIWSADLTSSTGGFNGTPNEAFDGNLNTDVEADSNAAGTTLTWAPSTDIEFTNRVEVATASSNSATFDGDTTNASVSGEWYEIATGAGTINATNSIVINTRSPGAVAPRLHGIRIDGQVYVDGVNSSYGPNGFHLDFSDPNDLGADRSGNGNDFTATGFNTDFTGNWSANLFTDNRVVDTPNYDTTDQAGFTQPASNGFNGLVNNPTQAPSTNGNWFVFRPQPNIVVNTSLRIRTDRYRRISVNEVDSGLGPQDFGVNTFSWLNIPVTTPLTLTNLAIQGGDGTGGFQNIARFTAIEVDGRILLDGTGTDYDLMADSPTQNWTTLNPLHSTNTLAKANLGTASVASWGNTSGTIVFPETGQYYYEFNVTSATTSRVGFQNIDMNQVAGTPAGNAGYYFVGTDGAFYIDGVAQSPPLANWSNGDVIGIQFDRTANEVRAYRNNNLIATWDISSVTYRLAPFVSAYSNTNTINFGQQPFIHTPPAGFEPLQTQNLPAADIVDGREHFRAITDTGANILGQAQDAATGFTNGLWWIKSRTKPDGNIDHHQLVDSVRGGNLALWSDDAKAETAYVAPAQNCVAWCWNCPDTFTPTVTGNLTNVTARRNVTAGFSIIAYTGSAQTGTITHGLDESPEFMIIKNKSGATGGGASPIWQVRHKDLLGGMTSVTGTGGILALNLTNKEFANSHGTVTVTADGTGIQTNVAGGQAGKTDDVYWWQSGANGQNYIAYCWHSVPGYSAFGSYEGTGSNTDTPFIYTGFRPAFVMCKSFDRSGTSWIIKDAARSPNNPVEAYLEANLTDAEKTNQQIDFLSNGFKIRDSATGQLNGSGNDYLYCAFAENPFGASNTSPATAR